MGRSCLSWGAGGFGSWISRDPSAPATGLRDFRPQVQSKVLIYSTIVLLWSLVPKRASRTCCLPLPRQVSSLASIGLVNIWVGPPDCVSNFQTVVHSNFLLLPSLVPMCVFQACCILSASFAVTVSSNKARSYMGYRSRNLAILKQLYVQL